MDPRLFYRLSNEALDFPFVGMLETTEPFSLWRFDSIPLGVNKCKQLLCGDSPHKYTVLDNSYFADHRIDLSKISFSANSILYFFFSVFCEREKNCFFYIHTTENIRIWHNEDLFSITAPKSGIAYTIHLVKGNNRFCLEYLKPAMGYVLTFWLNSFDNDQNNKYLSVLDSTTNRLKPYHSCSESFCRNNKFVLDYIFFASDSLSFFDTIDCSIIAHPSNQLLYFEKTSIKRSKHFEICLSDNKMEDCTHIELRSKSSTLSCSSFFPIFEYNKYYKLLKNEILFLKGTGTKGDDECVLDFWEKELSLVPENSNSSFKIYCEAKSEFDRLFRKKRGELHQTEIERVYFYSKLDGSPISYYIKLPKKYVKSKKYPLIALFSINRYDDYSTKFGDVSHVEDFVCADITGRGVTTGSYVGEASINEILEHIKSNFSIDPLRIYGAGHSNGAYAAWINAQLYPDHYAGIFPSSGEPSIKMLDNLRNMRVFSITSTQDVPKIKTTHSMIANLFSNNPLYTCLIADKHTHATLEFVYKTNTILQEMFKRKLDMYPSKIDYTTTRNRARSAYWIQIHAIQIGVKEGRIFAEILDNKIIISTKGITGFTIRIPPQIDQSHFELIINSSHTYQYNDAAENELHFQVDEKGEIKRLLECPVCLNIYKGDGLLHGYSGPMRIFLKSSQQELLKNVADALASPITNGYNEKIDVCYPILNCNNSSEIDLKDPNISNIVFLNISDNSFANDSINDIAPIKTNNRGYSYNGYNYTGNYCVMQIFSNPEHPTRSILYINANSLEMYTKNLFLRRIVLSSYASGFHPYYNNAALIYREGKYYGILDYGGPEILIKGS